MSVDEITELASQGKYDRALSEVAIRDPNDLDIRLLKVIILRKKEQYVSALAEAKQMLAASAESKVHQASVLIQITYIYTIKDKKEEARTNLSHFERVWDELTEQQQNENKKTLAYYYHVKSLMYTINPDPSNYDKMIELGEMGLELRKSINDRLEIGSSLNNLALFHFAYLGDYDKFYFYTQEYLKFSEKTGNTNDRIFALLRLGEYYNVVGRPDDAKNAFEEVLALSKTANLPYSKANAHQGLAFLFFDQGKHESARMHAYLGLTNYQELDMIPQVVVMLYNLILIGVKINDEQLIEDSFARLKELVDRDDYTMTRPFHKLSHALILKNKLRAKDIIQAQSILEEIIKTDMFHTTTLDAMLQLSEILLDELKLYGQEEVLDEVDELTGKIQKIAQSNNLFPLLVETLILRAKLAFIILDLGACDKILEQAHLIAEERGLEKMLRNVSEEEAKLQNEIQIASEISQRGSSILERMEKTKIKEYLQSMQKLVERS